MINKNNYQKLKYEDRWRDNNKDERMRTNIKEYKAPKITRFLEVDAKKERSEGYDVNREGFKKKREYTKISNIGD